MQLFFFSYGKQGTNVDRGFLRIEAVNSFIREKGIVHSPIEILVAAIKYSVK